ncbi:MAG: alpha/beta fold hydrolase [Solirubrobacterales bacterium]
MKQLTIGTVEIANGETLGFRECGGGPRTILFVHGNLVTSRWWEPFMLGMPDGFRCIAPDLRGAGLSTYIRPVESMRQFSTDLKFFAQEMGLKRFILVGLSMGGTISLQFACDYPEMVEKLILIDSPTAKGYPFPAKDAEGKIVPGQYWTRSAEVMSDPVQLVPAAAALQAGNREFIKMLFDLTVFNHKQPESGEYELLVDAAMTVKNYPDCAWPAQVFNISHEFNGVGPGSGEIDRVIMPVLVINGEHDVMVRKEKADELAAQIGPNARIVIIPEAAHCPHIDNPELVRTEMLSFMG